MAGFELWGRGEKDSVQCNKQATVATLLWTVQESIRTLGFYSY